MSLTGDQAARLRNILKAGYSPTLQDAEAVIDALRHGDLRHVDDMGFRREMAEAHVEGIPTLENVLDWLPERERGLLDALNDTGSRDMVQTVAVMLAIQIRREADVLMNGRGAA